MGQHRSVRQESIGGQLRVTFDVAGRSHTVVSTIVMWLAFPFLLRRHRARYRDQLANLKRAIGDNG